MTASRRPLLIHGGRLVDAVDWNGDAADILVVDGAIAAVGPGLPAPDGATFLDAAERLILPGLVNAHTHGDVALAKGMGDRQSLELLLSAAPFLGQPLTLEEIRLVARLTAAELLLGGCTACYDLFTESPMPTAEGLLAVAEGYADAGIRARVAPLMSTRTLWAAVPGLRESLTGDLRRLVDAIDRPAVAANLDACRAAAQAWRWPAERVALALGPTIPHHCDDDLFRGCRALADAWGLGIQTHLAESKVQAVAGQRLYGTSLTAHLDSLGVLGPDFTAAHGVWLDAADRARLADRGAVVAHNPASNLRLGAGVAPVIALRRAGVSVGIGTDANTCADGLNMFEAMRSAATVSRLASPDPADWLGARDALLLATVGSARALDLDGQIGRIEAGRRADLVFLDAGDIAYVPLNDARRQIVYMEAGRAVRRVMVDGRTVVADGRLLTLDLATLAADAERAAERHRAFAAANAETVRRLDDAVSTYCVGLCRAPHPVHHALPWA